MFNKETTEKSSDLLGLVLSIAQSLYESFLSFIKSDGHREYWRSKEN